MSFHFCAGVARHTTQRAMVGNVLAHQWPLGIGGWGMDKSDDWREARHGSERVGEGRSVCGVLEPVRQSGFGLGTGNRLRRRGKKGRKKENYYDRSLYMYENKQSMDKLPEKMQTFAPIETVLWRLLVFFGVLDHD